MGVVLIKWMWSEIVTRSGITILECNPPFKNSVYAPAVDTSSG